jgi:hypothetical protein
MRILILYSGDPRSPQHLPKLLDKGGFEVYTIDIRRKDEPFMDMVSDTAWSMWKARIEQGYFDVVLAAPDCASFCDVVDIHEGPVELRSAEHIEGIPGLTGNAKEALRKSNTMCDRAFEAFEIQSRLGRGALIDGTQGVEANMSLFLLPRAQQILLDHPVRRAVFDMCAFGCTSKQPTELWSIGLDLSFDGHCMPGFRQREFLLTISTSGIRQSAT